MAMSSILNFVWALRDHSLRESMSLICIFKIIPLKCILIIISLNCNIQSWKDFIELSLSLVMISLIQMIPSFKLYVLWPFTSFSPMIWKGCMCPFHILALLIEFLWQCAFIAMVLAIRANSSWNSKHIPILNYRCMEILRSLILIQNECTILSIV